MQGRLWIGAGTALAVAIASGIGDWRRRNRRDPDRVGLMPWTTLQMFALLAALILASLAMNDQ